MAAAPLSSEPTILYEDNHLIAVDKPAGMLSQRDLRGDLDVLTMVKAFIKRRDGKPGNVYVGLVHRLDRPVGGAMLLAKTSKAAGRICAQFRQRDTRKIYRAVVEGAPVPPEGRLVHRLEKDRSTRVTRVVEAGGKEGRLSYRVLGSSGGRSLVEVDLETGLPHQIRAQLSAVGTPVVGDVKYGAAPDRDRGAGVIALYSRVIEFDHPVSRQRVRVVARPSGDWPWNDELSSEENE